MKQNDAFINFKKMFFLSNIKNKINYKKIKFIILIL